MGTSFKDLMVRLSDEELMNYLINYKNYTPEAITDAVDELKSRGKNFTDQELSEINEKIETRIKDLNKEDNLWGDNSWKANVVKDLDAPLLYSKGAIRVFCILFTTLFGAVLLLSNINDGRKKMMVLGFGIMYTALTIILVNILPINSFLVLLLNTVGGLALTTTFWDIYVGKETKYRAKPIWIPLIISIVITIPFLLAIIYGY